MTLIEGLRRKQGLSSDRGMALKLGISHTTYSAMTKGWTAVGHKSQTAILRQYPDLSPDVAEYIKTNCIKAAYIKTASLPNG